MNEDKHLLLLICGMYAIMFYRPQTKFAKVMFYTCLSVHGEGGWYPRMPCMSPGGVSRSTPGVGGFPGPHLGWGGFQVHTWGVSRGVSRSTPGGSPGPQPGGGSPGPHPGGGSAGTHLGEGVSQHALRQTPPCGRLLPRAVCILLECILFFKDSLLDS